jgi:hypothetical protein
MANIIIKEYSSIIIKEYYLPENIPTTECCAGRMPDHLAGFMLRG